MLLAKNLRNQSMFYEVIQKTEVANFYWDTV